MPLIPSSAGSLVDILRWRAALQPNRSAYIFLGDCEKEKRSYQELDAQARRHAARLGEICERGDRVVLFFSPGLRYIDAFFGCLYAGLVPVPLYPPRPKQKLLLAGKVISDCGAKLALTSASLYPNLRKIMEEFGYNSLRLEVTDDFDGICADHYQIPEICSTDIAFLQYTSGSTGTPKGVVVSHGNLMANEQAISAAFATHPGDRVVSWLPLYHDMGLIGTVLQALYMGFESILMSSVSFIRDPLRWLELISEYGATLSGAPNFAFELCLKRLTTERLAAMDLSSWRVAFNGAEPVRAATLKRFTEAMAPAGFRKEAFYPCYGMAEATLLISGDLPQNAPAFRTFSKDSLRSGKPTETQDEGFTLVGCGRQSKGHEVLVVDADRKLALPNGTVGELWVSGPSVAQGYWNREELSKTVFGARLADKCNAGPFMRTGDLGFLKDDQLFVTGRLKDTIIIRGRNYAPQDIEATVQQSHPALVSDAGAAFSIEQDGEEHLVVVQEVHRSMISRIDQAQVIDGLRAAVFADHELKLHTVVLLTPASLPKTSSGKIQRFACKTQFLNQKLRVIKSSTLEGWEETEEAVMDRASLLGLPEALRSAEMSRLLQHTAASALNVSLTKTDWSGSLSRLGLDSMKSIEMQHRIESGLGILLPIRCLLEDPTLDDLVVVCLKLLVGESPTPVLEKSSPLKGGIPLSPNQKSLWVLQQLAPESAAYNISLPISVHSSLDIPKMQECFRVLVERHQALNVTFKQVQGIPEQHFHEQTVFTFRKTDVSKWSDAQIANHLEVLAWEPFDLDTGPMLRVDLLERASHEHRLLLTVHHLVADFWSLLVLMEQWGTLYEGKGKLPEPSVNYLDFINYQKILTAGERGEKLRAYWQTRLAGDLSHVALPTLAAAGPRLKGRGLGKRCAFKLDEELTRSVKEWAYRSGTTLYVALLTAFEALLFRYSGQTDILLGTPCAGRGRADFEGLVGYCVNMLALRLGISGELSSGQLIERTREMVLEAMDHQDLPFQQLLGTLGGQWAQTGNTLFNTVFAYQNPHQLPGSGALALGLEDYELELGGLKLQTLALQHRAVQFDLTMMMTETAEPTPVLLGSLEFDTTLFDMQTCRRMVDHFTTLLRAMVTQGDLPLGRLPLLTSEEKATVHSVWNNTDMALPLESPGALFIARCAADAEKIAVSDGAKSISYGELHERATHLAHRLRALGVGSETLVAVCCQRSVELVVGCASVLLSGGAWVPLDPDSPRERLLTILADCAAPVLLTTRLWGAQLNETVASVIYLDELEPTVASEREEKAPSFGAPENAAYVIYTSGSTGKPKGVVINQGNLLNLVAWHGLKFQLTSADRCSLIANPSFDASVWEMWPALIFGASLHVVPVGLIFAPRQLRDWFVETRVTLSFVPTPLAEELISLAWPLNTELSCLLTGGDRLHRPPTRDLPFTLFNNYGPTESTVLATSAAIAKNEAFAASPPPPIGRPLDNIRTYVLNADLELSPVGVPGELCIAGAGLARGYLNKGCLTAAAFVPNNLSQEPGARLYKTGDLVRYLADGQIHFLDRIDKQVKIRGYRIEPGEIEAILNQQSGVASSAVLPRTSTQGDKQLIAYLVLDPDVEPSSVDETNIRERLREQLPEYMIPTKVIILERMPLTANGKVDHKALALPDVDAFQQTYVAPVSLLETQVADIFAEVLKIERVGLHDHFFERGGHSLLAAQFAARVRENLGIELPLRTVFRSPTVASLAIVLERITKTDETGLPKIERVAHREDPPLSFAQQRLWFLENLEGPSPVYNIPLALRFNGPLVVPALQKALNNIVARHAVMRTRFTAVDGEPRQRICAAVTVDIPLFDLTSLDVDLREQALKLAIEKEAGRSFRLAEDVLMRVMLWRTSVQSHTLLINLHHILGDGWSMDILIRELADFYNAYAKEPGRDTPLSLPDLAVQYSDFAAWQHAQSGSPLFTQQLAFWRQQLAGAPLLLDLPLDRPRPRMSSYHGSTLGFKIERACVTQLTALGQSKNATLFMVLQAAFMALLARYTHENDLSIGFPIANRPLKELEPLIGFLANTLTLRCGFSGDPSFLEFLTRVRASALDAYSNQDVPFERVVEAVQPARHLGHAPLFQVMIAMQRTHLQDLNFADVSVSRMDIARKAARFDMTLFLEDSGEGIEAAIEYKTDLFELSTISRISAHFQTLLNSITDNPENALSRLAIMADSERASLLHMGESPQGVSQEPLCIHKSFEDQVLRTPGATALITEDGGISESLSYAELNARANRLARQLTQLGATTGKPVAICLDRSSRLITGMLAILKTGAFYVPLDPSYPWARQRTIVEDVRPVLVLTQSSLAELFQKTAIPVLNLDDYTNKIALLSGVNLNSSVIPANLSHAIYTSGSTGVPKGVAICHSNFYSLLQWSRQVYSDAQLAGVFAATSVCFDLSVFEIFVTLSRGGTVILGKHALSLPHLKAKDRVTLVNTVPSAMAELVREHGLPASVGTVNLAGEPLRLALVNDIYRLGKVDKVYNLYGPSEDTTYSTFTLVEEGAQSEPAIGRPLPGTHVYLTNPTLDPVPLRVPGEITLSGQGLASHYLGRPGLTALHMVPDPFSRQKGARLYKTGDLGRFRGGCDDQQPQIEFLGRIDFQVKIRGFRIELGEIEVFLGHNTKVREAVVIVRKDREDHQQLVAFAQREDSAKELDGPQLRAFLTEKLPSHMIPSQFVVLDELPRLANGKVDRTSLVVYPIADFHKKSGRPPSSETEQRLLTIWGEVLGLDGFGVEDNFFDLGGHSLLATRIISRLRHDFAAEIPLRTLFEAPTIALLAEQVDIIRAISVPHPATPFRGFRVPDHLALSYAQERLWFLDRLEGKSTSYHMLTLLRMTGLLRKDVLEQTFTEIVKRHEILRTYFAESGKLIYQVVNPPQPVYIKSVELGHLGEADQAKALAEILVAEASLPFDLTRGPLMRLTLLHFGPRDFKLLGAMHHIIFDGWSMSVLLQELVALYGAFCANQSSPLHALQIQYADFSGWQREKSSGEALKHSLDYWAQHLAHVRGPLPLPADRSRPKIPSYKGGIVEFTVSAALTGQLRALATQADATLFMCLHAALTTLLARYSGWEDIAIGTPVANRDDLVLEPMIGLFVNTLVLKLPANDHTRFIDLLEKARQEMLTAHDHRHVPFEKVVAAVSPERDLAYHPLFQVMLTLQKTLPSTISLPGVELEQEKAGRLFSLFDLTFVINEGALELEGEIEYSGDLFDRITVETISHHFLTLLKNIVQAPKSLLPQLALMDEAEREELLVTWNSDQTDLDPLCIHQLFEAQVRQTPEAVAVVLPGERRAGQTKVSYQELDKRANRLADQLTRRGLVPEKLVGILIPRSLEMLVGVLGVLKAGGAYLPLSTDLPPERLTLMIQEAKPMIVITRPGTNLNGGDAVVLSMDTEDWLEPEQVDEFEATSRQCPRPDNMAYVLFTSGSTGVPKGVMVTHQSLTNHSRAVISRYELCGRDRVLQFAGLSFDVAAEEIFPTLSAGSAVVLHPNDLFPAFSQLTTFIEDMGISVLNLPASYWHLWVSDLVDHPTAMPSCVRLWVVGSEAAHTERFATWLEAGGRNSKLLNAYGPTEGTITATVDEPLDPALQGARSVMAIGRPLANMRTYIVDGRLRALPKVAHGELLLAGLGLARGYYGQPALTAERFVPDHLSNKYGERLYRTGDLARYMAAGPIEILGRIDQQIKIRGFRVELGEIEAVLKRHPKVGEAAVMVYGEEDKEIDAFVQSTGTVLEQELHYYLEQKLPLYMVPAHIVIMDVLPRTSGGKIDRRALPKPSPRMGPASANAPMTGIQKLIADIWSTLLGRDALAIDENFFSMGGHSLMATRAVSRIAEALSLDVPLRMIFEAPTIKVLSERLELLREGTLMTLAPIERAPADEPLVLSSGQERMWLLEQLEGVGSAYNISTALKLEGLLLYEVLNRSLTRVAERHAVLHTSFHAKNGKPYPLVASSKPLVANVLDLVDLPPEERQQEITRLIEEDARLPFVLSRGPLFRVTLLRVAAQEHIVLISIHHIISDGWSVSILIKEITELYRAFSTYHPDPLPPLSITYTDYAFWLRTWLSPERLKEPLDYWLSRLRGAPALLSLPIDHPRPVVQTFRGSLKRFHLPSETLTKLKSLSAQTESTLFMALYAAYSVLLARVSSMSDIVVGTPVANRQRPELESLIGLFVNTVILRNDCGDNPSFRAFLQQVRPTVLGAFTSQEVPFEFLVDALKPERSLSYSPVFQVMFIMQNTPNEEADLPGLHLTQLEPVHVAAKFDLTMTVEERADGLDIFLEYNTDLFEAQTAGRLGSYYLRLLEGLVHDPDCAVEQLPLMDTAERHSLVVAFNDTQQPVSSQLCLHQLVEHQAARTPMREAVLFDDGQAPLQKLSYQQLNARAERLALRLRELGAGPDVLVGLLMERSLEMVVGMLGILKSGAAYLPMDPSFPVERLTYMLTDSQAPILLSQQSLIDKVATETSRILLIDGKTDCEEQALPEQGRHRAVSVLNLAYVIYTSGSTGKPKGVRICHHSVVNFLASMQRAPGLGPEDTLLAVTTMSFDISVLEIFLPLSQGARLVLASREQAMDMSLLHKALREHRVTCMQATPETWRMLLNHGELPHDIKIISGGEALPRSVALKLLQGNRRLWNLYGPTETTIWSAASAVDELQLGDKPLVPVGPPIDNTSLYILDRLLNPVPVGIPGELYIGGMGLARNYLDRAALTAERFLPNDFDGFGQRLYRTGDIARFCPLEAEGTTCIDFLGRVDNQIKLHGYRIELGEIETVLRGLDSVLEAVVLIREIKKGDRRLVAFLQIDHRPEPDDKPEGRRESAALRVSLEKKLPSYMIPAIFVRLDHLPTTANDKIDRKALSVRPLPQQKHDEAEPDLAIADPNAQIISSIWSEVLGIGPVGLLNNFFELGGNSLLATQLISRLNDTFSIEIPLRFLFEAPTVISLSQRIATLRQEEQVWQHHRIKALPRDQVKPMSYAQQRLWVLDHMDSGKKTGSYNIPLALSLKGPLRSDLLEQSFQAISQRHEVLRTSFPTSESGTPLQVLKDESDLEIMIVDLSGLPELKRKAEAQLLFEADALRPFDIANGALFRVTLYCLKAGEHVLIVNMHHMISDLWSLSILVSELTAFYEAFASGRAAQLEPLQIQYSDFSTWQRGWLQGEVLERQETYWKSQLKGAPGLLELPYDRPRPPIQTHNGKMQYFILDKQVKDKVRTLCGQMGITSYMCLLAPYILLLSRYSGQKDISVGSAVANRTRTETEPLIGFFANALVIRQQLDDDPTVTAFLARIRKVALEAYAHQHIPFMQVVEVLNPERTRDRTPLYQVMFDIRGEGLDLPQIEGLTLTPLKVEHAIAKFDLTMTVENHSEGLRCSLEYNTDLFDEATVIGMAGHYRNLLDAILPAPERRLSQISMLSPDERTTLIHRWNDTDQPALRGSSVLQMFEARAAQTPNAIALEWGTDSVQTLSFLELNICANQIAHKLCGLGVTHETRVGVALPRCPELVMTLLGILKAGGAYVPMNVSDPMDRLTYLIQDTGMTTLVTMGDLIDKLPSFELSFIHTLIIDEDWELIEDEPTENLATNLDPNQLAYLIYTSGSTGLPKGVAVLHGGFANYIAWALDAYALAEGDGSPLQISIGFDAAVTSLWLPLAGGKKVVLVNESEELEDLARVITNGPPLSLVKITPAHLAALDRLIPAAVKIQSHRIICGGEALPPAQAEAWLARGVRLINEYGPTETVVGCCIYEVSQALNGTVPIGRAIANTRLYLLDGSGQPTAIGLTGELFIAGDGLARGYHNRPALTAERFVPDAFASSSGGRLYKTGDLCRRKPDGNLDYLGRVDHQVKLRGYRIELGEIEAVLTQHPEVAEAVVQLREDRENDARLVAYLLLTHGKEEQRATDQPVVEVLPTVSFRNFLEQKVPKYMIPSVFLGLKAYPLTSNGKVDRKALPEPRLTSESAGLVTVSRTPDEEILASIWSEVLGVVDIGPDDNFFNLGGHSLLVIQVLSRIRDVFGIELQASDLFETATIVGLTAKIQRTRGQAPSLATAGMVRASRDTPFPMSFAQERLWFINQLEGPSADYNIPTTLYLRGDLHLPALEKSIQEIVRRHEVLRTSFPYYEGKARQHIRPPTHVDLPVMDLSGLGQERASEELRRLESAAALDIFHLSTGPLWSLRLVRRSAREHVLLLSLHHMITDGSSVGVLIRELSTLYQALCGIGSEAETVLPELPFQYGDFASWQHDHLVGEVLERQMRFWREHLADTPLSSEFPTQAPTTPIDETGSFGVEFNLNHEQSEGLKELSRSANTTLFMTLFTAFNVLLYRYSGQDDLVVGTDVANRNRTEIEGLIGFFVNQLALRTKLAGNPSFKALLAKTRKVILDAYAHQDVPFQKLVEELRLERKAGRPPLFQVKLVLQNIPEQTFSLPGLEIELPDIKHDRISFDILVMMMETKEGMYGVLKYNPALFTVSKVEQMIEHFQNLLRSIHSDPELGINDLSMIKDSSLEKTHAAIADLELSQKDFENLFFQLSDNSNIENMQVN